MVILTLWSRVNRTVEWTCNPGECPTNISTGEKDCTRSVYNPSLEVCSSPYECNNQALPYAVIADNSTSINGMCDSNMQCRCVRISMCSQYTTAVFDSSNPELAQYPYQVGQPNTGLCSVAVDTLFASGSYCTISDDWSIPGNKLADVSRCIISNPCISGQLAYLADPSQLNENSYNYYPLACVVGRSGYDSFDQPITEGSVAIWDTGWGGIVQKQL